MRRPSILVLLACSLVAMPASGSDFWEQAKKPLTAESEEAKQPKTFDDLLAKAEKFMGVAEQYRKMAIDAARNGNRSRMRAFSEKAREAAKDAIRYYDKALDVRPDEPDLHFQCGELSYLFLYEYYENNGPVSLRDKAGAHAVEHWAAFERLAPDDPRRLDFVRDGDWSWERVGWDERYQHVFEPHTYQFSRSIYYTKLGGKGNYEKAIEDYDFLLDAAPRNQRLARWIAQLLTNSAEIHMAIGNVDEAIARYREGLEYSTEALYRFGLAVALDRADEKESALEMMREALGENGDMSALARDSVFFIPKGDVHYYYGLAFMAQGKKTEALLHFREYVDRIKDQQYIQHARDHIDSLTEAKKSRK